MLKNTFGGLRLALALLFSLVILSPVVATGAGAQELTCADFTSEAAAQAVLDADPALAESLDEDGDGVACNEDADSETPLDSDDATPAADDEPASPGDAESCIADIQGEVDDVVASFERYNEIDNTFEDAPEADQQEMILEIEEIATGWSEYPDVAAEYEAPEGLEDLEDAYLDFAGEVGAAGDAWLVWWEIPAEDDAEEEVAFEDFVTAYETAQASVEDVTAEIEAAGGESPATAEAESGDEAAYLETVRSTLDQWESDGDRLEEILNSDDVTDADVEEVTAIIESFAAAPDVAAEVEVPEGMEEIQATYEDVADELASAADSFNTWLGTPDGSPEETEAMDAFLEATDNARSLADDLDDLLTDAGA
jgi:hypothetical protein